jgi:hypothetical protein
MKNHNIYLFILYWLLPVMSFAQEKDITGMWYGQITIIDTETVSHPYEIAVSEERGKLVGYSRIVFHNNGKNEAGVQKISIRREDNNIIMEDEGFIEHNFSANPAKGVKKTMIVVLTTTDSAMILEGSWSTNRTRTYRPLKGIVLLKRKIDFKKLELFKSLDTLKLVSKLSFKDRPETEPVVAVAKPVEKKPEPLRVVSPAPDSLIVTKNAKPSTAKISSPSEQKELQMDTMAKSNNKPVVKPAPVTPNPGPVVIFAAAPKQEQKTPPPPPPKPESEKKPVVVAVQPQPKPAPPVTIVAPSIVQGAAEVEKRVTKSDKSFYFETDSLLLTLYDNGEVDGDTVTVLMNGNIIFSKVGLTTKANSKTIYIPSNMDSVKLVMYAESLGKIPPNTGLMVVTDGEKKYEVRFSADLKTNSAIVFQRKRKDE